MTEWEQFLGIGFILVGILVLSPTSDLVTKTLQVFQNRFGLQPVLAPEAVTSIRVNGTELTASERDRFIQYFNHVNFLYHGGFDDARDAEPVRVEIHMGRRLLVYSLYAYDEQIEVVRRKHNQALPYRVLSANLSEWLSTYAGALHSCADRPRV